MLPKDGIFIAGRIGSSLVGQIFLQICKYEVPTRLYKFLAQLFHDFANATLLWYFRVEKKGKKIQVTYVHVHSMYDRIKYTCAYFLQLHQSTVECSSGEISRARLWRSDSKLAFPNRLSNKIITFLYLCTTTKISARTRCLYVIQMHTRALWSLSNVNSPRDESENITQHLNHNVFFDTENNNIIIINPLQTEEPCSTNVKNFRGSWRAKWEDIYAQNRLEKEEKRGVNQTTHEKSVDTVGVHL